MLVRSDDIADGVRLFTIDRPEVRNALSMQANHELDQHRRDAEADDRIRCVVLTGAGDVAFSAGNDIHELDQMTIDDQALTDVQRRAMSYGWFDSPLVTVAAINGQCYGMGAIYAVSSDFRVGGPQTRIKITAGSYGGANLTWNLPDIVGWAHAKDILMTSRPVDGPEAFRMGLLNRYAEDGDVIGAAVELASTIAANPVDGIRTIKRLIHDGAGRDVESRANIEHAREVDGLLAGHADGIFDDFVARSRARRNASAD